MNSFEKRRASIQCAIFILALLMIWYGIDRGEMQTVLNKAINICLECVGLG